MYDFDERNNIYASLAVANREPIRKDFRRIHLIISLKVKGS